MNKKLKYGTFSTLTAVFVIVILLLVNLVAGQLGLSYDLTPDKLYSLSNQSREALADLDADINIYALYQTGASDEYIETFRKLLDEYTTISKRIKVEFKDPYLYPQFVEKYRTEEQDVPVGSIIVEGPERFKVIPTDKLVSQEIDYSTFQMYVASIDLEPQVTNAIKYVVDGKSTVVYVMDGHGEQALSEGLTDRITLANFELKTLNLLNLEAVPEDCNVLFVTTPQRDWTKDEAGRVKDYLDNDGRAMFFMDYSNAAMPNLDSVLESYGITPIRGIVFEGNRDNYFQGNPVYLVPERVDHEITAPILEKGYPNILPLSIVLQETELKRTSTKIEPLLISSKQAYAKTNSQSQSIDKEPGDLDGPFMLSVAVTETTYTDKEHISKLVATAASTLLDDSVDSAVMGTNFDFVINALNWTQDKANSIYISPKTTQDTMLTMNAGQAFLIIGFSVAVPVAIIVFGLVVWFRRRNS